MKARRRHAFDERGNHGGQAEPGDDLKGFTAHRDLGVLEHVFQQRGVLARDRVGHVQQSLDAYGDVTASESPVQGRERLGRLQVGEQRQKLEG